MIEILIKIPQQQYLHLFFACFYKVVVFPYIS